MESNNSYTYRSVREAEVPSFLAGVKILTKRKYFFGALLACAWGAAFTIHTLWPKYVASSTIFVRSSSNSLITTMAGGASDMRGIGGMGGDKNSLDKYLNYFETYQYAGYLANQLLQFTDPFLPQKPDTNPEMQAIIREFLETEFAQFQKNNKNENGVDIKTQRLLFVTQLLQGAIDIYESKQDSISVRITSPERAVSVHMSNFILKTISESIVGYDTQELVDTKNYLVAQIADMRTQLSQLEDEFVQYLSGTLERDPTFNIGTPVDTTLLRKTLEESTISLRQNQTMIEKIKEQRINSPSNPYSPNLVNILRQNSEALKLRRDKLLILGVDRSSRQIQNLENQIKETHRKLEEAEKYWIDKDISPPTQDSSPEQTFTRAISTLQSENRALNARIESVKNLLKNSANESARATEQKQRLDGFSRKIALTYVLSENLQKKLVDIEIQKVSLQSKVKVIESATLEQVKHKVGFMGKLSVATVLAILFGVLFSYISELFNTTVRSRHDLIDMGITVLGSIPLTDKRTKVTRLFQKATYLYQQESMEEMAFKQIRTRVTRLKKRDRKDVQVICVLSSVPGEGKSFFATSLAKVLAQLGQPTLFMDCDVRRPSSPMTLGFENKVGVTQILAEKLPWRRARLHLSKYSLDVIPSGPMNDKASELFSSETFRDLLDDLRKEYRYVIIDCPPILPVADGVSISCFTDASVLVASYQMTQKGELAESLMRVAAQSPELIYGVLNRIEDANRVKYSHLYLARSQEQIQKQESIKAAVSGYNSSVFNEAAAPKASTGIRIVPKRNQESSHKKPERRTTALKKTSTPLRSEAKPAEPAPIKLAPPPFKNSPPPFQKAESMPLKNPSEPLVLEIKLEEVPNTDSQAESKERKHG